MNPGHYTHRETVENVAVASPGRAVGRKKISKCGFSVSLHGRKILNYARHYQTQTVRLWAA